MKDIILASASPRRREIMDMLEISYRVVISNVREELDERKIPYDHQGFYPHITLARKPVLPSEDALISVQVPRASMIVREVCLYQSLHEAEGMRYIVLGKSGRF